MLTSLGRSMALSTSSLERERESIPHTVQKKAKKRALTTKREELLTTVNSGDIGEEGSGHIMYMTKCGIQWEIVRTVLNRLAYSHL